MDDSTIQPPPTRSLARSLSYTSPPTTRPLQRSYSERDPETIAETESNSVKREEGIKYLQLYIYSIQAALLSELGVKLDNHSNSDSNYSVPEQCHELLTSWNKQASKQSWKVMLKSIRRFGSVAKMLNYSTSTFDTPHFKVTNVLFDILSDTLLEKSLNTEEYKADLEELHGFIDWSNIKNMHEQQEDDMKFKMISGMHIPSDREIKIINAVSDFYKESSFAEHRPHVIAALVIEEDGMYRPVILAAGTKYSKQHGIIACFEGDHWNICDGHAEAICYQMAIIYILKEICNIQNKKPSIFESSEDQYKYKLKETIKFHLLISQRPCGFIAKKASNFLSWKRPLHILECSSKILIGSFLGIQGPLSCILSKPVHVSSVLILEDWRKNEEKEKNEEEKKKKKRKEKPDLSDVKDHFLKFHKKLKEYNADENMLLLPNVTICKVDLQVFFNNLLAGKPPKDCHLTFNKAIFRKDANFRTAQRFYVDKGENIESKIINELSKISFLPSLSSLVKNILKTFKICNEALEIDKAIEQAYNNAKEHLENLAKSKKEKDEKLLCMLVSNISENSEQAIGNYEYLCSYKDKQEDKQKNKQVLNAISSLEEQMRQTSVALDIYEQLIIKYKTFKCLTEVDCDWAKWISILHGIEAL